ncbi:C-type lectin domain family 2 member D, partial [Eudyptes moseleyi]
WVGFQGKCYYFSETENNWTTSQESCEALGASLAVISTVDELEVPAFLNFLGVAFFFSSFSCSPACLHCRFEVRGSGQCAYLNQERISSSLCHTKKNWLCSRPDNYVLWQQKAHPL